MALIRQHLIDPEICIRCNTCEEACPDDAITHDDRNYVIDFDVCTRKGDCLLQCPTGAIDSYRKVIRPWTVEEQYEWDFLPSDAESVIETGGPVPAEVERLQAEATHVVEGKEVPKEIAPQSLCRKVEREAPQAIQGTCPRNMLPLEDVLHL